MGWHGWLTLVVVIASLGLLATERLPAALVLVSAVAVLLLTGVINSGQALSGLGNPALATVAGLYVIAGAARTTDAMGWVVRALLGRRSPGARMSIAQRARLVMPAAGISAFIQNTPLVSMLAPRLTSRARQVGVSIPQVLLPFNIAVLVGGTLTAIGTTTNVVISGLLVAAHQRPLGLFEPLPVAVVPALGALAFVVLVGGRMLPSRPGTDDHENADQRPFTIEMEVAPGESLADMTVAAAGLRNLPSVYLLGVVGERESFTPVAPDTILRAGDHLLFTGSVAGVLDLRDRPGLIPAKRDLFEFDRMVGRHRVFEAVIAAGSSLVGTTLKATGFRAHYSAAVLAIHHSGTSIKAKLGSVTLRPGDVLLVLAADDFGQRWIGRGDFALISERDPVAAVGSRGQRITANVIVAAFFVAVISGVLPILQAAMAGALASIALRVVRPDQVRDFIDVNVLVIVAASFGIAEAIASSHLGLSVATTLVDIFGRWGDVGILAGIVVATVLVKQLVTNYATAVLMFPIVLATAAHAHLQPRPLVMALIVASSAAFATPISYQTNVIVQGLGGYRMADFLRLGIPLLAIVTVLTIVTVPLVAPLR